MELFAAIFGLYLFATVPQFRALVIVLVVGCVVLLSLPNRDRTPVRIATPVVTEPAPAPAPASTPKEDCLRLTDEALMGCILRSAEYKDRFVPGQNAHPDGYDWRR